MMNDTSSGWAPGTAPQAIRRLVGASAAISLFCALTSNLFAYLGFTTPQELLQLSWTGLYSGYIWQPVSYLFVQAGGQFGITLGFLISLFFNLYILWMMGASTLERVGTAPFLRFYFLSGALSGLLTLLSMPLFGQLMPLAGSVPVILAILVVWTMLHPESELLLFFLIPIKARWLLPTIILLLLLTNLSQLNFLNLLFNLFGLLTGYLHATLIWNLKTPYPATEWSDTLLNSLGERVRGLSSWFEKSPSFAEKRAEIIDIHTGKNVQEDDLFMDSVLEKISKYGEKSLTWSERNRMRKISERKTKQRPKV